MLDRRRKACRDRALRALASSLELGPYRDLDVLIRLRRCDVERVGTLLAVRYRLDTGVVVTARLTVAASEALRSWVRVAVVHGEEPVFHTGALPRTPMSIHQVRRVIRDRSAEGR